MPPTTTLDRQKSHYISFNSKHPCPSLLVSKYCAGPYLTAWYCDQGGWDSRLPLLEIMRFTQQRILSTSANNLSRLKDKIKPLLSFPCLAPPSYFPFCHRLSPYLQHPVWNTTSPVPLPSPAQHKDQCKSRLLHAASTWALTNLFP